MAVPATMAVAVIMIMIMIVRMFMSVARTIACRMRRVIAVMLYEHLLCERIVFGEGRIVPMTVPAAISASFGMKRQRRALDLYPQPRQHGFKYRIGFEFQIVRTHFHGRMAIAEMISGACERKCVLRAHDEHRFYRCDDAYECAIVGDEDIRVGQHGAARQDQCDFFTGIERRSKPALAPLAVGKRQGRRTRN